jgi:hypothetical protein
MHMLIITMLSLQVWEQLAEAMRAKVAAKMTDNNEGKLQLSVEPGISYSSLVL